jgi:hypothetical protein
MSNLGGALLAELLQRIIGYGSLLLLVVGLVITASRKIPPRTQVIHGLILMLICAPGMLMLPPVQKLIQAQQRAAYIRKSIGEDEAARGGQPLSLPINPFENAQVGDFTVVSHGVGGSETEVRRIEVASVTDDKVELSGAHLDGSDAARLTVSRKTPPSCQEIFALCGLRQKLDQVYHTQRDSIGTTSVRGTQFQTRTLLFNNGDRDIVYLYMSPDVKGVGLVQCKYNTGLLTTSETLAVNAYGSAKGLEWGRVESGSANPVWKAEYGDWMSFSIAVTKKDGTVEQKRGRLVVGYRHPDVCEVAFAPSLYTSMEIPKDEDLSWRLVARWAGMYNLTWSGQPTTAEEVRNVGGRAFPCHKMHFMAKDEGGHERDITVWQSDEVRALGFVEATDVGPRGSLHYTLTGFGRQDTVEWGTRE